MNAVIEELRSKAFCGIDAEIANCQPDRYISEAFVYARVMEKLGFRLMLARTGKPPFGLQWMAEFVADHAEGIATSTDLAAAIYAAGIKAAAAKSSETILNTDAKEMQMP